MVCYHPPQRLCFSQIMFALPVTSSLPPMSITFTVKAEADIKDNIKVETDIKAEDDNDDSCHRTKKVKTEVNAEAWQTRTIVISDDSEADAKMEQSRRQERENKKRLYVDTLAKPSAPSFPLPTVPDVSGLGTRMRTWLQFCERVGAFFQIDDQLFQNIRDVMYHAQGYTPAFWESGIIVCVMACVMKKCQYSFFVVHF